MPGTLTPLQQPAPEITSALALVVGSAPLGRRLRHQLRHSTWTLESTESLGASTERVAGRFLFLDIPPFTQIPSPRCGDVEYRVPSLI